jgi:hypothetical protein
MRSVHDQMVLAVAEPGRVERHVHALRRETGLHVEERRQPVCRLADVAAAPAVFVRHGALHGPPIDCERDLPDTGARVTRADDQIADTRHRWFARELAADIAHTRARALFQRDVGPVEIDDGGVAVGVAVPGRAFDAFDALAGSAQVQVRAEVGAWNHHSVRGSQRLRGITLKARNTITEYMLDESPDSE